MPDGKTWFAQNLNYTQGLTYNAYASEANGKAFTTTANGVPAIGSYWCPPKTGSVVSGDEAACNVYGALYTWETAMMLDGKYADETKTSNAWEESWVSGNYYSSGAPGLTANADVNNARGGTAVKGGGRGICPMGWHIPTTRECAQLLDKVEGDGTGTTFTVSQTGNGLWGTDAGIKLKSSKVLSNPNADNAPSDGSWIDHANHGIDEYGFGIVPSGLRSNTGDNFRWRGYYGYMWTSTTTMSTLSIEYYGRYEEARMTRSNDRRSFGFGVRCTRD
jgi:uncharacterized protein (TIGR02145 family)